MPLLASLLVLLGLLVPTPPTRGAGTALHVDGPVLRDGADREVLLRGIAVIEKSPPYLPTFLDDADLERIRSWGLNSIRLGITWGGVMPSEGEIDESYVAGVRDIVERAAAYGLYVVLDMHQDVYGPPHGNGAPEWAFRPGPCPHVDLEGLTGQWAADNLSPAVLCAQTRFWMDETLQRHYRDAWVAVAEAVGDIPHVAGYDLMNEPGQGALVVPFEYGFLYPRQTEWLDAIRTVDPDAIGFFEPPAYKNVIVGTLPPLTLPAGAVYAPHVYGPWDLAGDPTLTSQTRTLADVNLSYSALEAELAGVPLWIGEFGVVHDAPGAADFVARMFDLADMHKAGVALWEYRGGYSPIAPDGTERPMLDALVRAYPHAVAGTIDVIAFDRTTRTLQVSWTQRTAGSSIFRVPARLYPDGVVVDGAAGVWDAVTGDLVVETGPGQHRVRIAPAS